MIFAIIFLASYPAFAQAPKSENPAQAPKSEKQTNPAVKKETTISTESKGAGVIKTASDSVVPPLPSVAKPKEETKTPGKEETAKVVPLKEADETDVQDMISFKSNFEKDIKCMKLPANARINIDFEDAPLQDVVKFFACITGENFIISANIKTGKTITIMSPNPVTVYEAYKAFLSALDVNNLTLVPSGKFMKIVESAKAKTDTIPVFLPGASVPDEDKIVTAIVQLNHVDIKDLEPVLNKFKSQIGDITSYVPTNTMIITDTGSNIKKLKKFIGELDIPTGKEKIWIRPVEFAAASEIAGILLNVFGDKSAKGGASSRPATVQPGQPGVQTVAGGETGLEGVAKVSKILQDERTNQLIILATPTAYLKIDKLIRKLDVPIKGEGQIHIYRLENADAEEIAQTLSSLASGGGLKKGGKGGGKASSQQPPAGQQTGGTGTAAIFSGEVKITAHKPTNTLVIESSLKDFMSIKNVIQELDVRRKQVYVEAIIMEISSNKDRKIGLSGSGGTTFNIGGDEVPLILGMGGLGISGFDMQQLSKGGIAVGLQGPLLDVSTGTTGSTSVAGTLAIPTYGFLLQAIQSNSDVNILSTPHILTMDNEEAEITVGKQIPYQAQSYGGLSGLYGAGGISGLLGGTTGSTTQNTSALAGLASTLGYGGLGGGLGGGYVQRIDVD
ncbi:MAG: type II secretion system secretin GspD, partial [Deltaproteobacteria bacterium]|nr:type II secretion system secretin GspD [Deltaproteobacteria bacterium]